MASGTIKKSKEDTGWLVASNYVEYRKIDDVVYVKIKEGYSVSTTTWNSIGVLPVGFRPSVQVKICLDSETNFWANVSIYADGNVRVLSNLASPSMVSFALG